MWQQNYTPLGGSLPLSALVAALPIFALLLLLGVLRKPAWISSLAGLAAAALVAGGVYGMPWGKLASAAAYGATFGLFPIGWVVFAAILLYRVTVDSGKFGLLKDSISHLTDDRRLQALLIAFAFGAFIEGASGFGTPVPVAAAMLAGLGFSPFYAAAICLLANTSPVAFGAIGTPLITLASITGLPLDRLSAGVGRICAPVSLIVPAYLVVVMEGWTGLRGVLAGGGRLRFGVRRHAVRRFELRRRAIDRHSGLVGGHGGGGCGDSPARGRAANAHRAQRAGPGEGVGALCAAGGVRPAVGLQAVTAVAERADA